jgi:sensor histidine kinase YesM
MPAGWELSRDGGVGLKNVAARLEHLYGTAATLRIQPAVGGGVDVSIELPRYPA